MRPDFADIWHRIRPVSPVILALLLVMAWHLSHPAALPAGFPQGRYHSSGQIHTSDGAVIPSSHSIRFHAGGFYAVSRQGDTLLESAGQLERKDARLHMQVSNGTIMKLSPETDNELIQPLLYGRHPGASITLHTIGECLYARASLQVYCPVQNSSALR